jgi:serine/threonine protein phosphatase PrpC
MQFSIYQESRRGARKSNQDRTAYCYSRNALLMLVADGMGGHLHGEAAAEIATQFITGTFRREAALADPAQFLRRAIIGAHRNHRTRRRRQAHRAPLTTCVACVIQTTPPAEAPATRVCITFATAGCWRRPRTIRACSN